MIGDWRLNMFSYNNGTRFAYYFSFIIGSLINILLLVGIIATRETRIFWLFIGVLGTIELYGTYTLTLGQLFAQDEAIKKIPPRNQTGFEYYASLNKQRNCRDDSQIVEDTITTDKLPRLWYCNYINLSETLLNCRLHLGPLSEELEVKFVVISDLLWKEMNEEERELAERMSAMMKGYYDELKKRK